MSEDSEEAEKKALEEREKEIKSQMENGIRKLDELDRKWQERGEEAGRRLEFTRGIALGLIYGIIGNLAVQHWYPVFEGIVLWKLDNLFWTNLIVFVVSLTVILGVTVKFSSQMKKDANRVKLATDAREIARIGIKARKERLERKP